LETICERIYQGVTLRIMWGDITDISADAIVNPANSLMIMGGGVAGVLKRVGGDIIEREARKYAPVPIGKAVVTPGGLLRAKYVIHAPTMEKPAMRIRPENVYHATFAALTKAFDLTLKTIAFPGMGTGIGGLSPKSAGREMIRAIREFLDMIPGSFREIIIIDINRKIPETICEILDKVLAGKDEG
jgi:O-acetyl-ADP-ribose deacetylase (regulator of RNase III)